MGRKAVGIGSVPLAVGRFHSMSYKSDNCLIQDLSSPGPCTHVCSIFKKSWFYIRWPLFSGISFLSLLESYFHGKQQKPPLSSHFYPYSYLILLNLSTMWSPAKRKIFILRIPICHTHWISGCNLLGLPKPLSVH